jgi:hypothetical protein
MNYISHPGKRANTRNLKHLARHLLNSKDLFIKETIKTTRELISDDYLFYRYILKADKMKDELGISFLEAMNKLAEQMKEEIDAAIQVRQGMGTQDLGTTERNADGDVQQGGTTSGDPDKHGD